MPLTYPILTNRLILRPFEDSDLNDVVEYHSRPDVVRYLSWETKDAHETKEVLEKTEVSNRFR